MQNAKYGGYAQDIYKESATQKEALGTLRTTMDGRTFVYAKAGGTALAVAKLVLTAAVSSNANNVALPATPTTGAAIGATTVSITFGGAFSADAYKDGFMHVNDATGEGYIYRVKSHPAATAGNSYTVNVELYDPIRVALAASTSKITFTKHPQDGVVVLPAATAAAVGAPAGVPPIAVTASYYFWNQVKGPCVLLTAGTIVLGNVVYGDFTASTGVAGAVMPASTLAMQIIGGQIGTVLHVNASTEYSLIMLGIPGY